MTEPTDRPAMLTLLCMVGILMSALGLCCSPMSLLSSMDTAATGVEVVDRVTQDPGFLMWNVGIAVGGLFASFGGLATFLGLMRGKGWAIPAVYAWSAAQVLLFAAKGFLTSNYGFRMMIELLQLPAEAMALIGPAQALSLMCSGCFALAVPVWACICVNLPHVRAHLGVAPHDLPDGGG